MFKRAASAEAGGVTFRNILAFENFVLLMAVVLGLQLVDRSFGPVLPLFVASLGVDNARVPLLAGTLFSVSAGAGAIGNPLCGRLMRRSGARPVIAAACGVAAVGVLGYVFAHSAWWLALPTAVFGVAIGAATTAAYTAASSVIPHTARGSGFGVLTTASLVGLAVSPIASGLLAATSIRAVFIVDVAILAVLAVAVKRLMITAPTEPTSAPAVEEV